MTTTSARLPAPKKVDEASELDAERKQLDQARSALAAGDANKALLAVADHERRFAAPKLAEEREAIAIQALVIGHRYADARARAAKFTVEHPNSVLSSAIDSSLASIPDE